MPRVAAVLLLLAAVAGAETRLVLVGPGPSPWARFGHVLLRDGDACYDFGHGDATGPGLLWSYLRGTARFRVVVRPWLEVERRYAGRDRTLQLRTIRLTLAERTRLAALLAEATRPDHASYVYDHERDNCVTRLRDLLDHLTGGALRASARGDGGTYRPRTLAAMAGAPGVQIALDLLGGKEQDRALDAWEACYLPARLDALLAAAQRADGSALAGAAETVHRRGAAPVQSGGTRDGRIAVVAAALVAAAALLFSRRAGGAALLVVAPLFAVAGLAIWMLVLVSHVPDYASNENAWLFWPTDALLIVVAVRRIAGKPGLSRLVRLYVDGRLAVTGLLGAGKLVGLWPQDNLPFLAAAALVLLAVRADRG